MLSPTRHAWVLAAGAVLGLLAAVDAAAVTYDFNVTWVKSNPDGLFERPTIGINGQWPVPQITATVGDNVVIRVTNLLGNESTSLHFHGLYMNGTTHMDGPPQVTQCEILPGLSFTYNFTITQPGTYWYHSHTRGQYPDGLRGALVIQDPASPYLGQYDQEVVLSVSDWYHDLMSDLLPGFLSKRNPTGAEPVPNAALFNDTKDLSVRVEPGKTYLFRMVNIGAFAGQYIWFENHKMTIVEVDGVYTQPAEANLIYMATAQRYSFLLTAKNETDANYAFIGSMDTTLFDALPDDLDYNVTGWLVYDETKPRPDPALVDEFQPFDDMTLVPYDNQTLLGNPDRVVELNVIMDDLGDGANYAFFNNITYTAPKVPTLYTALTAGDLASNPAVYGGYTNTFVLEKGQVVQITVNNLDTGRHPFHLHGHNFQAVYRSAEEAGTFADANVTEDSFPRIPMRRDTLVLYPQGSIVLRFRADNPGVWLFHCHIEWHVVSGLIATFVEAPRVLQETLKVPQDHYDVCAAGHVPVVGNAAAHSVDWLDLGGQNAAKPPLPDGFTTRGIVALALSCLCGLLGVAVVAWYGLAPDPPAQQRSSEASSGRANGSVDVSPMAKDESVVTSTPARRSGQL